MIRLSRTWIAALLVLGAHATALAQSADPSGATEWGARGLGFLGSGLGLGIAALGGALAQGRVAEAALAGIARNPHAAEKLFTPFILALALIESLVIYALIIAYLMTSWSY